MGFPAAPLVSIGPVQDTGLYPAEPGRDCGTLPAEIRFLADALPSHVLRWAAGEADRIGVTAEVVLLADGILSPERYYRALARSLGLPFAERPVRPAGTGAMTDILQSGIVPLRPNAQRWRFLAAPRGKVLRRFIATVARGAGRALPIAITSPERFEALLRHDRRREVVEAASHGLPDWNGALSARSGVSLLQAFALCAGAAGFCVLAWRKPDMAAVAVGALFTAACFMTILFRLVAAAASPRPRSRAPARVEDADLPVYSIIVPLFREAGVVKRLCAALDRLDYPHAKLDIILVVEESDTGTFDTIERLNLPGRYRTVMAPAGRPRTKPRALNVALQFSRGSCVVIYDAEDEPEPGQLRAAAAAFASDSMVVCLQARLAIDNLKDGWLAALFTIEYAALFHVVNPGLAKLGLPIPLGGTSNHFRTDVLRRVNGWDAWNVTEDIDLGIRLARFGHRVGSLESTTFEEAPNTLKAWLKQRCRWMKGWMVTLGTHSRAPGRLWRELGTASTAAVMAMLVGTVMSSLLGPFCVALLILRAWTGNLFWTRTPLDLWLNAASAALLGLGTASALWPALLGLRRRRLLGMAGWLVLYPCYLVLLCVASWQALFEVFGRPHAWAKTEHGRAKHRFGSALQD